MANIGDREEITDLISDAGIMKLKKGKIIRFSYEGSLTTLKVTRIDRKNMRIWAEHINLVDQKIVYSHLGHRTDKSQKVQDKYGAPFCEDCGVPVNEPSTEDGEVKAKDRADRSLADGTIIE